MNRRKRSLQMWAGFALGVVGVALLLPGWTVRGGSARPGAVISLAAQRSVDLDVQPVQRPLATRLLVPSGATQAVGGELSVRNATGAARHLTLHASVETRVLDSILRVRVREHGRLIFVGSLESLRRGVSVGTLPSHASLSVRVEAWLPADAGNGYVGRREQIKLSFVSRSVGSLS